MSERPGCWSCRLGGARHLLLCGGKTAEEAVFTSAVAANRGLCAVFIKPSICAIVTDLSEAQKDQTRSKRMLQNPSSCR